MRELKFRAWDKGYKFYTEKPLFINLSGEISRNGIDWSDRYIIEQFTGLRDKNGEEIYEGDIVSYPDRTDNKATYDVITKVEYLEEFAEYSISSMAHNNMYINVIGNIHENPELFKEAL